MDEVYNHWTRRFLFTVGVKHMADENGAWWLVDLVSSYVGPTGDPRLRGEEFQVWRLAVNTTERTGTVTVDDGNGNVLLTLGIDYCDYPEPECKLYLVGPGPLTLMKPEEY